MDKVSVPAFHVMCDMWGVDTAIRAVKNMGMTVDQEQAEAKMQKEKESQERFNVIFKPKEN